MSQRVSDSTLVVADTRGRHIVMYNSTNRSEEIFN